MSSATRQMHLGVFVLGIGNHSADWRWEGAATSHMQLPVMQEIARIAERGKFDLLFISDSTVMEHRFPHPPPPGRRWRGSRRQRFSAKNAKAP